MARNWAAAGTKSRAEMRSRREILFATVLALSACSAGAVTSAPFIPLSSTASSARSLFVANGANDTVSVYDSSSMRLIRTIKKGILQPLAMAVDARGYLYVAGGQLSVYAPGRSSPSRTLPVNGWSVAIDREGHLYATDNPSVVFGVCPCGNVYEYSPRGARPLQKFTAFEPAAIGFDTASDMYVADTYAHHEVAVYRGGSVSPYLRITKGIGSPHGLAFDAAGSLYVANLSGSSVTVYAPGTGTLIRTITVGVYDPTAILVDKAGNLYVANLASPGKGTVTIYAPGQLTPFRTLRTGKLQPAAIALDDATQDLYVAEAPWTKGQGMVAVFGPKSATPKARITDGINGPVALAMSL